MFTKVCAHADMSECVALYRIWCTINPIHHSFAHLIVHNLNEYSKSFLHVGLLFGSQVTVMLKDT